MSLLIGAKTAFSRLVKYQSRLNALLGLLCGSAGNESACNVGDLGSIPGLGRSLEKGKATHSSIVAWRIPWTVQRVRHD